MFARFFTANLGVSTFPIGSLFYLQTDLNARGPESRRPNAFQRRSGAPALRVSDAWVVLRPNYLPFLSITAAGMGNLSPHYP
jgi:hypothetical protein